MMNPRLALLIAVIVAAVAGLGATLGRGRLPQRTQFLVALLGFAAAAVAFVLVLAKPHS